MHIISSLTAFDLIFIGIIAVSVLFGLIRGCIKSTISLLGWLISAVIALKFSVYLLPLIEKYNFSHSLSVVIAAIATFVIAAIIIAIFNSILISMIKDVCGGLIDRSSGLALGFVRGCAIASVVFFALSLLFPVLYVSSQGKSEKEKIEQQMPTWAKDSKSIILLSRGSDVISSLLPPNFKKDLKDSLEETAEESAEHIAASEAKKEHVKTVNQVLKSLPPEVLDQISADDLLVLQDNSASSAAKAKILNGIANQYHQYVNNPETANHEAESQQYFDVVKNIEDLVTRFNSPSVTSPALPAKQ